MAIAHVQSIANGGAGSATTVAATTAGSVTAGDLIVLFIAHQSAVTISSVADGRGTTYNQIGSVYVDSGNGQKGVLYYGIAAAGTGAITVTVTFSATCTFRHIVISEYSGNHASPLDQFYTPTTPSNTATGTDATKSDSSITPSVNNCLIYAGFQDSSGTPTVAPGTSPAFNERTDDTLGGGTIQVEDLVQGSAVAVFGTWTVGTAGHGYQGVVASFKPATAGGSSKKRRMSMGVG